MNECPACRREPLVELEGESARIELCRACRGMLLDGDDLQQLADSGPLEAATTACADTLALDVCLRCNTRSWHARSIPSARPSNAERGGVERADLHACGVCGMVWLLPGALERLRAHALSERRRARHAGTSGAAALASRAPEATGETPLRAASTPPASPAAAHAAGLAHAAADAPSGAPALPTSELAGTARLSLPADIEPFDRISFERGAANWIAAPASLVLALSFCSTDLGRFFGPLVGMPFHELGHALTSWLSSRFAVPLPFFTVWHEQRSPLFGLVVAAVIASFGVRSWLERRRFGLALALVLLASQLALSWLVPARHTLMLQILGGALGEIVLGALVLVAFHFPLPDRLRWDFWRWPALVPGSICLAHALSLWTRAARDVRFMPWGAAIGDESDGDMNRLVNGFGWRARELASFYLKVALLSVAVIAATQVWAWHRARRLARHLAPERPALSRAQPESLWRRAGRKPGSGR